MITRDFTRCPECGAPTKKAIAFNGGESEFWYECTKCNTFINTYIPQEQQVSVHEDTHTFIGNFGGYGSGKTLTSREEVYKHIFLTPGGNTLIGANVASQYEQTIKRDIEADLPIAFVKTYSTQKQYIDLINDHRIMFRPFDDPNKLRSYNLSMFVIQEASEVKEESFTQLKTRLRNMVAGVPKTDEDGKPIYKTTKTGVPVPVMESEWLKGIIESNPDAGWIRNSVLMVSDEIYKHGNVCETYGVDSKQLDKAISSHITTTECNEFLPPDFIERNKKNKPAWWVARYLYGSFMYAAGMVYPNVMRQICDTFEIPKHWKRIVAYDYGLSDPSHFVFGAIDEGASKLYIYKEIVADNKNIAELAKLYHEGVSDIPSGGMICPPIIDPKSGVKRDYDKKTLLDHFLDYNINFKPGHINVDARIFRLNTYIESGQVLIMDCCTKLISELKEYKFQLERGTEAAFTNKPVDKNNHGINALEWIVMELPANPKNLLHGVYNKFGQMLDQEKYSDINKRYGFFALSDPKEDEYNESPLGMIDYNTF